MSTDKLIFKPTNRNSITEIEPNNNAVAILDDRVFDITSGNNAVLNAIESIDTGLITGNVNIDLILSALEAVDSSNITADNLITAYLEESENLDTVLLSAKAILTASLTETDNNDTVLLTSAVIISNTLEVIEDTDITNIEVFSGTPRNAEILITESQDTAVIRVSHKSEQKDVTYVPLSRVPVFRYPHQLNATIAVTENSDSCRVIIEAADRNQIIRVSENSDGVRINSQIITVASASVKESGDGVISPDRTEFIEIVNFKNEQYEKSEFELFRMVA